MMDVVVLFFLLGLLAGLARSELKLPAALYDSLSVFLMIAIGRLTRSDAAATARTRSPGRERLYSVRWPKAC